MTLSLYNGCKTAVGWFGLSESFFMHEEFRFSRAGRLETER